MNCNILAFAVLLSLFGSLSVDWQGYGNMSSSNLTDIWTYINSTIVSATTNPTNFFEEYSANFSTHLNSLWDPAWNVITIKNIASKDTVLYGYAFRDHWMWYNGYRINGLILTFVIWKDYNCQNWFQFGTNNAFKQTGFTNSQEAQIINSRVYGSKQTDIWGAAKEFMNNLKTKQSFSGDKAYSVVLTQGGSSYATFYGRVCIVGTKYEYYYMDVSEYTWGRYFLFQTR